MAGSQKGKSAKKPKKMGRPKVEIDLDQVEKLASIQCTIAEIASVLDIPASTLKSREDFSSSYKKGLEQGKMSLRRIQYRHATRSPGMAIFLGKVYLGQSDKPKVDLSNLDEYMANVIDEIRELDTKTSPVLPR